MRSSSLVAVIFALAVLTRPAAAHAQSSGESRLREALRTTAAQLRALEEERDKWQGAEAALKQEVESLRKELAAAKRAPPSRKGECASAQAQAEELGRRLAQQTEAAGQLTQSLNRCQAAAQASDASARTKEQERSELTSELTALKERLAASEVKNERMFRAGKEMLDWLVKEGFAREVSRADSLLGMRRAALENAAQDYEDKLLEQREKR
jgi:chromosome segregation ATPase